MRRFLTISLIFLFFSFFFTLFGCATLARKETKLSISIEKAYLKGESAKAIELIKQKLDKSKVEEQLLFLMEAGTILHTTGQYERSNGAFLAAEKIIQSFNLSGDDALLLSDVKKPFRGENFEHVLVRLYIAFNYIMLGEKESALIYFRRVNQYLAQIKTYDAFYKQNYAARFLYAILAEELKNFNDARVQYNNLKQNNLLEQYVDQGLRIIAEKEQIEESFLIGKSSQSIELGQGSEEIFYYETVSDGEKTVLKKTFLERQDVDVLNELGSLVVVHSHGFSPVKASRGTLADEGYLGGLLVGAVTAALISRGQVGVSSSLIFSLISSAENPVPLYKERKNKKINFHFQLGDDLLLEPQKFDDYTDTVLKNYNENYKTIADKNRDLLVGKIVAAILSTEIIAVIASQAGNEGWGLFAGIAGGLIAGSVLRETIYPDLRSWRLMYDSLYIERILLKEGVYPFGLVKSSASSRFIAKLPEQIAIKKGENTYVMLRSY